MSVEKLMPTRAEFSKSNVILDLDEIQPPSLSVKINGIEHILVSVKGKQLRALHDAENAMQASSEVFASSKRIDYDMMVKSYFDYCKLCVPTLTMEDMNSMTTAQMVKLLNICVKYVSGATDFSDEKKNSKSPEA